MQPRGAMRDGWSKTGTLLTGNPVPEGLTLQADFAKDRGGSGAEYYTIQFGVQPPISGVFDTVATIKWSTDGADVFRQISVGNGVTISGTAQHARVSVVDRTNLAAYVPLILVPEQYRVDILITPGVRPSRNQPPTLIPPAIPPPFVVTPAGPGVYTLAPAASLFVPIPNVAGVVSVNTHVIGFVGAPPPFTPLTAGDAYVGFVVMGAAISLGAYDAVIDDDAWVPVPAGATHLQLFNDSAVNVQFTVQYGIEG